MSSLVPATFLSRPNRFIVMARTAAGRQVRCHLGDPGRLRELLLPGAELRLRPASPPRKGAGRPPARRTRYTVALVRASDPPRPWVSLETTLANRLAEDLFRRGLVRAAGRPAVIRREVARGRSRFDFLLEGRDGSRLLVEVKSVSLVERGVALFPDAPTARGARHVAELEEHVRGGGRALILFVVQRDDARLVRPHAATDPAFASALARAAAAGVDVRAVRFRLEGDGSARYAGPARVGIPGRRGGSLRNPQVARGR